MPEQNRPITVDRVCAQLAVYESSEIWLAYGRYPVVSILATIGWYVIALTMLTLMSLVTNRVFKGI